MKLWLVLTTALLAVSAAGTLVRLAPDAHALTLAFGRVLLASLLLAPFSVRGFVRPAPRDLALMAAAGTLLALHFWSWFSSLAATSVLRSTVLVCTTPVWVGLLEAVLLRRPPPRRYWPGIALALVGIVGLATSARPEGGSLRGDALALLGSWLGAGYFVIGSVVRPRVAIGVYGPAVCLSAAAALLVLAVAQGVPLWSSDRVTLGVIVAMALGPQILGHIGFNWAMRYVPASVIATVILLEPLGAAIVAALTLGEMPTPRDGAWALVLFAGVGMAVWPAPRSPTTSPPTASTQ